MNRPDRILEVYEEFRRSAGDVAEPAELLLSAAGLVGLFDKERLSEPRSELRTGGLPFAQWALDRAMQDGGWRVMAHESELVQIIYEDQRDGISDQIEVEKWLLDHAA